MFRMKLLKMTVSNAQDVDVSFVKKQQLNIYSIAQRSQRSHENFHIYSILFILIIPTVLTNMINKLSLIKQIIQLSNLQLSYYPISHYQLTQINPPINNYPIILSILSKIPNSSLSHTHAIKK